VKPLQDMIECEQFYMFPLLNLINLNHLFNLLVFFSWFTGEGPNWTLTLESTYIYFLTKKNKLSILILTIRNWIIHLLSMFIGTSLPLMEDVHDLENEISTISSSAAITEKFVPWILQHGHNCKLIYWIYSCWNHDFV